jgi:hypothetical protein
MTTETLKKTRSLIAQDKLTEALKELRIFLENSPKVDEAIHQSGRFRYIRKQMRLGLVSHAEATLTQNQIRFGLLDLLSEIETEGAAPRLPRDLTESLVEIGDTTWVLSLRQDLLDKGVAVRNERTSIMGHYGWLIEVFLQKMLTKQADGSEHAPLLRFSHMAEAFQSTLRYLCYIQVAQLLQSGEKALHPAVCDFVQLPEKEQAQFDYLNLLLITTESLPVEVAFMPEITAFVDELSDTRSDVYQTALFLDEHRRRLLQNTFVEDEQLPTLLEEYLTGFVFWLRQLAFLAKYRLASIKDITLNYRLGTAKKFVHLYGELHGIYNAAAATAEDYGTIEIEDLFTYNQSILLFKGSNMDISLGNISDPTTFISLSPLVIDQSVFAEKTTQTPEIYYYIGRDADARRYGFAYFKNELPFGDRQNIPSNRVLTVKKQNNAQAKLNDLFKQLELVFSPFRNTSA